MQSYELYECITYNSYNIYTYYADVSSGTFLSVILASTEWSLILVALAPKKSLQILPRVLLGSAASTPGCP